MCGSAGVVSGRSEDCRRQRDCNDCPIATGTTGAVRQLAVASRASTLARRAATSR